MKLVIEDSDGIVLEAWEDFGREVLVVTVIDEHKESVSLTRADAAKLIERLKRFVTQREVT